MELEAGADLDLGLFAAGKWWHAGEGAYIARPDRGEDAAAVSGGERGKDRRDGGGPLAPHGPGDVQRRRLGRRRGAVDDVHGGLLRAGGGRSGEAMTGAG